ncbi:MAG: high-affinity branched-chain amino acid ABC transporter permease LivM [Alphaproteobacteria bacterium]|nr:high-affinity branched-chain amino acid ABC transporter permease LivM [Alphaproteobacteria bacterium]
MADVVYAAGLIFLGRIAIMLAQEGYRVPVLVLALATLLAATQIEFPTQFLHFIAIAGPVIIVIYALRGNIGGAIRKVSDTGLAQTWLSVLKRKSRYMLPLVFALAIFLPLMPFADRYAMDVATMVLTYVALAWGLNIVVGYAGLLDLGYVAYYAIGAYTYALLAQHFDFSFWMALPVAGLMAVLVAGLIGAPVLRLRGDYLAIVTLGFAEIVRLVLINWTTLTGGPNGISGVPRPTFFGLEFTRSEGEGVFPFHEFFGLEYSPIQRVIYLYYLILLLAIVVAWFSWRLRKLPLGRAWEALRDDEIACTSVGINAMTAKLAAYMFAALVAGLAGAFFATRQGFISPESFTFNESVAVLAIVVLGGMGSQIGILLAALFIIGMPELFRELEQYRMAAFGAGMVLIMIWRPRGLMAQREPSVKLE